MTASALEAGYWRAYEAFYRWGAIARGAAAHASRIAGLRHFAYAAGWKKFEPLWDLVIRAKRAGLMLPVLESILSEFGRRAAASDAVSAEHRLGTCVSSGHQLSPGVDPLQLDVIPDRPVRLRAEPLQELGDDRGLVLRIAP
jgi:hypothetical protein